MITKAVIFAAGRGTRMRELTKDKHPKHLIEIHGRPFLSYVFDFLLEVGLKQLIVVVGHQAQPLIEWLEESDYPVTIVNQFAVVGEEKYGTACAIMAVKDFIENEEFLALNGDNLYSAEDLRRFLNEDGMNYIGGLKVPEPSNYGILKTDEQDFLQEIIEKPKNFVGDLANVGLYKFTPEIFRAIETVKLSPRKEYEITDAVTLLAREHSVKVLRIKEAWHDFGRPEDVVTISHFIEQHKK
ncbi:MAG: NTP transferase domain-containing protein [Candidatus Kerfeldbacteria bacterium]|nr:NTP transferase domain-containing protein [Candidatus Kerfeldbacteria bacterium]